jgi:hypothetical protein
LPSPALKAYALDAEMQMCLILGDRGHARPAAHLTAGVERGRHAGERWGQWRASGAVRGVTALAGAAGGAPATTHRLRACGAAYAGAQISDDRALDRRGCGCVRICGGGGHSSGKPHGYVRLGGRKRRGYDRVW